MFLTELKFLAKEIANGGAATGFTIYAIISDIAWVFVADKNNAYFLLTALGVMATITVLIILVLLLCEDVLAFLGKTAKAVIAGKTIEQVEAELEAAKYR